jgi:hypothetical protein
MWKETVSIDEAIALLNEAVASDPAAMKSLVETRVRCNVALGGHPTIQVTFGDSPAEVRVGLLGIINGLFGVREVDGYGRVQAVFDKGGSILCFQKTP